MKPFASHFPSTRKDFDLGYSRNQRANLVRSVQFYIVIAITGFILGSFVGYFFK